MSDTAKAAIRYFFYGLGGLYCLIVAGINIGLLFLIGPLAYIGLGLILAAIIGFWFLVFKVVEWAFD